jgi:hypothetical protein
MINKDKPVLIIKIMQLVLILINSYFALTGIYWRTKTQFIAFMFTEPEQCNKSIFNITLRNIHFLFSADVHELNVINIKLSVFLDKLFFYLYVRVTTCPPPYFAVEFCFCGDVRLIRLTNHVNCSELPTLWLSAGRNCDLCQSASYLKEGIWCTFRRIT